jgi:hypothetical protein
MNTDLGFWNPNIGMKKLKSIIMTRARFFLPLHYLSYLPNSHQHPYWKNGSRIEDPQVVI